MKKDEDVFTLEAFLEKTKETHEARSSLNDLPIEKQTASSAEARALLKKMLDELADLADHGDRAVQEFLVGFSDIAAYLIATASKNPGEPCPDCGKIH